MSDFPVSIGQMVLQILKILHDGDDPQLAARRLISVYILASKCDMKRVMASALSLFTDCHPALREYKSPIGDQYLDCNLAFYEISETERIREIRCCLWADTHIQLIRRISNYE